MKILCLFVRHGTTAHPDALERLDEWYDRYGLKSQRTLWIIDNALDPATPPATIAPGVVLRPGDNSAWEFSAWDRALREAATERIDFDVVHFVTSAFNTLYTGYLNHFRPEMLDYVLAQKVCLGHLDSHPVGFELEHHAFSRWIRTGFFFLPRALATALAPLVAYQDPTRFFASPGTREFRPDAPLSENYRAHLSAWLHGQEIGGHAWHSPVGAGPMEIRRFQAKVLAIVNEHRLSLRLRQPGVPLVDFCWLHLQGPALNAAPFRIVAENEQLVARRRVLNIPEPDAANQSER